MNVQVDMGGLLATLLTVLFVGLKLTGRIAWSWWWVLSPVWIPMAIALIIIVFAWMMGAFK